MTQASGVERTRPLARMFAASLAGANVSASSGGSGATTIALRLLSNATRTAAAAASIATASQRGAPAATRGLVNATLATTAAAAGIAATAVTPGPLAHETDQCHHLPDEHLDVRLSTFWYCFLAFITIVGLVVSLVSNMIIIYLFTGTPSLRRNPSNIIAVNLSLSDLLYCIQWPSVIYCSLTQSTWLLEIDYVCQTFGFITVITASASILTVLAMSIERALVIRYSIHAKSRFAMRHAWLVLLLIWCTSLAASLPPLFGTFNKYTLDPSKTSCTLDYLSAKPNYKLYVLVLYCAYWILPTIIISICYALIVRTFSRSSRSLLQAVARRGSQLRASGSSAAASQPPAPSNESGERASAALAALGADERRALMRMSSCESAPFKLSESSDAGATRALASAASEAREHLRSSLSLRSHGRDRQRVAAHRLRDSIRLHSFMGRRPLAARHTAAPDGPKDLSRQEPRRAPVPRQFSAATDDGGESQQAAGASLSLGTSSTWDEDFTEPEPSSTSHEWHCTESIVEAAPPSKLPRWRWFTAYSKVKQLTRQRPRNQTAKDPPARSGKFSFDANTRSTTCYELSSLRTSQGSATRQADDRPTASNLNKSISTLSFGQQAGAGARAKSHQAGESADRGRLRLRAVSCHFGGSSAHLSRTSMQIRLAKMSFYLILLWLVSWTPIASLGMINSVVRCHHRVSALAVFLANTMTKLGPAFDVFIYGVSHPKIKKEFRLIIKWLFTFGSSGGRGVDQRHVDSLTSRNASIKSKCSRPNASLAVY